jgi:uncharacterized OB-fold protein
MKPYEKPIPEADEVTRPFWEAARQGRLMVQRCLACGGNQFYPQASCRGCLSEELEWMDAKGTGTIYSYTVVHRAPNRSFDPDVPYTVALVDLDEGCRMITNIVEVSPEEVRVGMPVKVVFEAITPEISLPKFRPVETS